MSGFQGNISNNETVASKGAEYGTITVAAIFRTLPMILVSIAAFIGNSMVLLAIKHYKNLRTFSNMYVGSLAITDVAVSLIMPFSYVTVMTNGRWIFGDVVCIINGFLLTFLASTSMLTLLVFSIYRCYLVTTVQKRFSVTLLGKIAKASVFGVWFLAFIYACPTLFGGGEVVLSPTHYTCILNFASSRHYVEFLFVALFMIPLIVMTVAYIRIANFISMHNKTIKEASGNVRRPSEGTFSPSSEASATEGNRYTVMELKRKLDLMNVEEQRKLQSPVKEVTNEVGSKHLPQPTEVKISDETKRKSFEDSSQATTKLRPSESCENIVSHENVTYREDETPEVTYREDETQEVTYREDRSQDSISKDKLKKISVSSIVHRVKSRINKKDFLRQYRKRVSHQTHLVRILFITVLSFVLCWTPFAIDAVLLGLGYTKPRPRGFQLVSQWMAFSNAICNPIIYALFNARFKDAFKDILDGFLHRVYRCC